jgi:Ca2+-binding RTX toxin-like protein
MRRTHRGRLRPSLRSAFAWGAVFALLAATAALGARGASSPHLSAFADGELAITDSRAGEAIVSMSNLYPGGGAEGDVAITNSGDVAGTLALSAADPADPGAASALLGADLKLAVTDVTPGGSMAVVSGPYAAMPGLELGTLQPGEERDYRFAVDFPDGGGPANDWSGDNVYQHLATALDFDWTLTQADEGDPGGGGGGGGTGSGGDIPTPVPPTGCSTSVRGDSASNRLFGTDSGDNILGGAGSDLIYGEGGNDCLYGQHGNDRIVGGAGNDFLGGGAGRDWLVGGSGSDVISAARGGRDTIDCGGGHDFVIADSRDRQRRC